jgi:hypothetical protein
MVVLNQRATNPCNKRALETMVIIMKGPIEMGKEGRGEELGDTRVQLNLNTKLLQHKLCAP